MSDTESDQAENQEWLRSEVTWLIQSDPCKAHCLVGKAGNLQSFAINRSLMSGQEKKLCVMTALTILQDADGAQPRRKRTTGIRKRFHYYVPFVGEVCQVSFLNCFDISASTLARYKRRAANGIIKS